MDTRVSGPQLYRLGAAIVAGFFLVVGIVLVRAPAPSSETVSMMLQGVVGLVMLAAGFFFGAAVNEAARNRGPAGTPGDPVNTTVTNTPDAPVPVEPAPPEEGEGGPHPERP